MKKIVNEQEGAYYFYDSPNGCELIHIDATPDIGYPIRILEAYRKRCNYKWTLSSTTTTGNDITKMLNDLQDERAEILDKAIAILYEQQAKKKNERNK